MVTVSIVKTLVTRGPSEEAGSEPCAGRVDINRHLSRIWSDLQEFQQHFMILLYAFSILDK